MQHSSLPEGKRALGRSSLGAMIILKLIIRNSAIVDKIHPAQDRVQWRGLVNVVIEIKVS
jgi:hypothetical protein